MRTILARLGSLVHTNLRGQTLVEYGLLIALIAVVVIVALLFLGPVISELYTEIGNTLDGVPNSSP